MKDAIKHIRTNDITETNTLLQAAGVWVANTLGLNLKRSVQSIRTEPRWKRRIEGDIKVLRRHILKHFRKRKARRAEEERPI